MQKWWIVGAGVVGVGLAVLMLGRPFDTGEDVEPTGPIDVTLSETEGAQPGGLVRGPDGAVIEDPSVAVAAPEVTTPVRSPTAMIRPGTRPVDPALIVQGANPAAARAAARRDTPEARYAAQSTAPWTQIRREIAQAAGTDPNAAGIIRDVQVVLDDLKHTQRDPQSVDFEDVQAHQAEVIARIKESPYSNTEVERMLGLIDERTASYKDEIGRQ